MTFALIVVGILLLLALVGAAGGFDRGRLSGGRRVARHRPVTRERVVERPVTRERVVERDVEDYPPGS
ncbi:MAG: hypothetical protein ABIO67_11585 [Mycobacteriales bacterium]